MRGPDEILGVARVKIHPGKVDEFIRLSEQCLESVRNKDKGTLQYDLYLSEDRTEALVVERYRDSQGLADHHANLGPLMGAIMETASFSGEVCGKVGPEMKKMLDGAGVRVFSTVFSF